MSLDDPEPLIRAIHNSDVALVLAMTGGGASAIGELLRVPGGSRTMLEATVPYASEALVAYLKSCPEQFCAEHTARLMAIAAYQRGVDFRAKQLDSATLHSPSPLVGEGRVRGSNSALHIIGVGCTASLASDRPKHGTHRAHLAWQSASTTASLSIELKKDARTRADEEELVTRLLLNLLAEAAGVDERANCALLSGEELVADRFDAPAEWQKLLAGSQQSVREGASVVTPAQAIFPGAFAPRHEGHRQLVEAARQILGAAVEYEISIDNVDKPPLDFIEMRRRAAQFHADEVLWFTRAPTFVEKARLFPGVAFLVGVDTIVRIADSRYYEGQPTARDAAIAEIAARRCRFLVFGRAENQAFRTLADIELPAALGAICEEVPASLFRADVSSTELRRAGKW